MLRRLLIGLLLVCSVGLCFGTAVHEDQFGESEWFRKGVGSPRTVQFHPSPRKRLAFVGTDANIVAAMNVARGLVVWRQPLPASETLLDVQLGSGTVYVLSQGPAGQPTVRAFHEETGYVLWDFTGTATTRATTSPSQGVVGQSSSCRGASCFPLDAAQCKTSWLMVGSHIVVLTCDGDFYVLEYLSEDGEPITRGARLSGKMCQSQDCPRYVHLLAMRSKKELVVRALGVRDELLSLQTVPLDGSETKANTKTLKLPSAEAEFAFLAGGHVVVLAGDSGWSTHLRRSLKADAPEWQGAEEVLGSGGVDVHSACLSMDAPRATATYTGSCSLWAVRSVEDGAVRLVGGNSEFAVVVPEAMVPGVGAGPDAPFAVGSSAVVTASAGEVALESGKLHRQSVAVTVSGAGAQDGSLVVTVIGGVSTTVTGWEQHTLPTVVATRIYPKKDAQSQFGARVLVAGGADGAFGMLSTASFAWEQGAADTTTANAEGVVWLREEGVSQGIGAFFASPSAGLSIVHDSGPSWITTALATLSVDEVQRRFASFTAELTRYWRGGAVEAEHDVEMDGFFAGDEAEPLHSDAFGFQQVAVVASKSGVLFGLNAADKGRLLWRLPALPAADTLLYGAQVEGTNVCVVAVPGKVVWFTCDHGQLLGQQPIAVGTRRAVDSGARREVNGVTLPVLVLASDDDSHVLSVFPQGASVPTQKKVVYHHDEHGVRGFQVGSDAPLWSLSFGPEETVEDVTGVDHDSLNAVGRAVRTHGVAYQSTRHKMLKPFVKKNKKQPLQYLYKYLNPNMLVVTTVRRMLTETEEESRELLPGVNRSPDPTVHVYVVDAVSGSVLEHFKYRRCTGPVRSVVFENMILTTYFSQVTRMWEVSVLEAFYPPDKVPDAVVSPPSNPQDGALSTWALSVARRPVFLQQAYQMPRAVRFMHAVRSRFGVNRPAFLFALESGQVLALGRELIDPLRPSVGNAKEAKEVATAGLVPYHTELPSGLGGADEGQKLATAYFAVHGLHTLVSRPTRLESTTHSLALGTDLFYSHIVPSTRFDRFSGDFNYAFLVATVMFVAVLFLVTRRMAKQKTLRLAWR